MVLTRRGLALSAAAVMVLSAALVAQKKDDKKPTDAQKRDIPEIVRIVDAEATGQPAANDFGLQWVHADFLKAASNTQYVAFTLTFDASKAATSTNVALYWRVVAKDAAIPVATLTLPANKDDKKDNKAAPSKYAAEYLSYFNPTTVGGRFSRAFVLPAGNYDVYMLMRESAPASQKNAPPAKVSGIKQALTVPDFWAADLTTSSIIVASRVEPLNAPLSPNEQFERPYAAMGGMDIVPALDTRFTTKAELSLFLLIYNPKVDGTNKPDVTVEYNFYQKLADTGEKFFNRTPPQLLNASTLPASFDMAIGHQLSTGQAVPLASFPAGDYRLEIKITDKLGSKSVTRDVNFTVTAG